MKKKAIIVKMPIIENIDFLEIAKTFDDKQLCYVVKLAQAYEDLEQELKKKDKIIKELIKYMLDKHFFQKNFSDILDKLKELEVYN